MSEPPNGTQAEDGGSLAARLSRRARMHLWEARLAPTGEAHDRFGLLLALLVTAFVVSAFQGRVAHAVAIGLNLLMVLVAFRATGMRAWRHLSMIAAIGLAGTAVARLVSDADATIIVAAWSQVIVLVAILVATVARILQHREVHIETLLGAFSAYFLIGLAFSWLYIGLNRIGTTPFFGAPTPDSEFPYFSFITLTTTGFGDYAPVGRFNQRMVVIEALMGQIFLASLVARLVSLFAVRRRPEPPSAPEVEGSAEG